MQWSFTCPRFLWLLGVSLFYWCLYTLVISLQNVSLELILSAGIWVSSWGAKHKRNSLWFCVFLHTIFDQRPRFIPFILRYPFISPSKLTVVSSLWQGGKWMIPFSKWRDQPSRGRGGVNRTATGLVRFGETGLSPSPRRMVSVQSIYTTDTNGSSAAITVGQVNNACAKTHI